MKKTIDINLGGMLFHLDEDAYAVLSAYLEALRRHLAATEGREEVLADIEAPTLVLYGSEDQLTDPSMLSVWRTGLPDFRGEVRDGAGHVLLYDRPREVAERMRAFLR